MRYGRRVSRLSVVYLDEDVRRVRLGEAVLDGLAAAARVEDDDLLLRLEEIRVNPWDEGDGLEPENNGGRAEIRHASSLAPRFPAVYLQRMASSIDFDDEDEVLKEMSRALDIPVDDLKIKEDGGLTSFGTGTVYEIELWRGGTKEWCVVRDDDQERDLALAIVAQDLEHEPEIFNKHFIESQIDEKKLRDALWSDVVNMRTEDLEEMASRRPDDFWREYEGEGFDAPEEDEDGERREPESSEIEELAEKQAESQLRDPMQYMEDIYGDEAPKHALDIVGFDIDQAAEEAVDTDGAAHFLSTYDGRTEESPGGLVFWRRN